MKNCGCFVSVLKKIIPNPTYFTHNELIHFNLHSINTRTHNLKKKDDGSYLLKWILRYENEKKNQLSQKKKNIE